MSLRTLSSVSYYFSYSFAGVALAALIYCAFIVHEASDKLFSAVVGASVYSYYVGFFFTFLLCVHTLVHGLYTLWRRFVW